MGYLSGTVAWLRRLLSPQGLQSPDFIGTMHMWRGEDQELLDNPQVQHVLKLLYGGLWDCECANTPAMVSWVV